MAKKKGPDVETAARIEAGAVSPDGSHEQPLVITPETGFVEHRVVTATGVESWPPSGKVACGACGTLVAPGSACATCGTIAR